MCGGVWPRPFKGSLLLGQGWVMHNTAYMWLHYGRAKQKRPQSDKRRDSQDLRGLLAVLEHGKHCCMPLLLYFNVTRRVGKETYTLFSPNIVWRNYTTHPGPSSLPSMPFTLCQRIEGECANDLFCWKARSMWLAEFSSAQKAFELCSQICAFNLDLNWVSELGRRKSPNFTPCTTDTSVVYV